MNKFLMRAALAGCAALGLAAAVIAPATADPPPVEAENGTSLVQASVIADSGAGGGRKVRGNAGGASLVLPGVTPGASVTFRYSSNRPTGAAFTIEFRAGSASGPVLGAPGVLGTGSWTSYRELTYNLTNVPAGTTALAVVFRTNDSAPVADLDWVKLPGGVVNPPPTTAPPTTSAPPPPPPGSRTLLAGQSTMSAYQDVDSVVDAPGGGSVYYELKSGTWVGTHHRDYATFLAQQGKAVQIGISWKDNPPGFTGGDENAKAARSRAVTQEIANGQHLDSLAALRQFMQSYPQATFYLRLDYEVSSHYHCTDSSCASYRNAFARIRAHLGSGTRLRYVFHPVRGEYEQLYPGNAVTDWIGVSIFAHELCLPIHDRGYLYNGTPPSNYDVGAAQCRNAYIGRDSNGNDTAIWRNWDHDGNVLKMMKFAKDRGKPMIVSESGLMNFTADGTDASGLEPGRATQWVNRLFGLLAYQGPIPNLPGTHDLSQVIQAVVFISLDFRYGWDGINDGTFDFPPDTTWFVDSRISRYGNARSAFCAGLAAARFASRC